jgi:subtilase family serine protease
MFLKSSRLRAPLAALALLTISLSAFKAAGALPAHNVPKAVAVASDQGRVNSDKELNLTVVLKLHNEAEYDQAVENLYNPASPTYHHWFTEKDFEKYAPTAEEFDKVKQELRHQGLEVVSADPQRFSIRVHGTAASAETAFQTELHTFRFQGRTFDAHTRDARLTGEAGELVESVSGLERHRSRPQIVFANDPKTGKPLHKKVLTKTEAAGGLLSEITNIALTFPETSTYGTTLPIGTFEGTVYDVDPTLIVDLTPAQLQAHYGLTGLIGAGYDGTGQTIALVEAYGYPGAEADANTSAKIFGLPPLTSANFSVIYPEGKPVSPVAAQLTGWDGEIALDIQSAHGIAPGAKIVVVASAGQDNEDQIASLQYIITHKVANAVSGSWENDSEIIAGPAEENAFNAVLKRGAAAGISFQFSTGDAGDQGLGTPVGDLGIPSDSPYATAVGGTSILNNPYGTGDIVAGWGNNFVYLNLDGAVDPPFGFFGGGAGGGESTFFAKPSWQKTLPGKGRQVPDISALADPYTGFPIILTQGKTTFTEVGVGGTSLASPIFTAIWAIADQYNGKPLGLAAARLPKIKAGEISDVLPYTVLNTNNVAGTIEDDSGTHNYSTNKIFAGLIYTQKQFPSALWNLDSATAVAISFGTDSSLTVTPGWDNVTGWGEPNGLPFIQGVSGKRVGAPLVK